MELNISYQKQINKFNDFKTEQLDFYTMWIHQIKTPIAAMNLLLQDIDSFETKSLKQELFKIERYTEIVLNYLRADDISSDINLASFCIEDIIKQAIKKYAPTFIAKNIKINLSNLEYIVITDDKWLCFVIEQLLSNSLKYMDAGTITISMLTENKLCINDEGIGIAPEDLPRLFTKGYTGYNGRMDKKATGLGLYLSKKILDKLQHTIQLTSTLDKGTQVYITFPIPSTYYE